EGVGAANSSQHGGVLDHGENLGAHLHHDLVCIAVREDASQRAAASHAITAGVVDDQQVSAASFGALGGDAGASADAHEETAGLALFPELCNDFASGLSIHGISPFCLWFPDENVLMLCCGLRLLHQVDELLG